MDIFGEIFGEIFDKIKKFENFEIFRFSSKKCQNGHFGPFLTTNNFWVSMVFMALKYLLSQKWPKYLLPAGIAFDNLPRFRILNSKKSFLTKFEFCFLKTNKIPIIFYFGPKLIFFNFRIFKKFRFFKISKSLVIKNFL